MLNINKEPKANKRNKINIENTTIVKHKLAINVSSTLLSAREFVLAVYTPNKYNTINVTHTPWPTMANLDYCAARTRRHNKTSAKSVAHTYYCTYTYIHTHSMASIKEIQ